MAIVTVFETALSMDTVTGTALPVGAFSGTMKLTW
jgi:hypothetical protein